MMTGFQSFYSNCCV